MTWARLDDAILDNPKILRVGPLGFALHVAAITHCARNLTDGYVEMHKAHHLLSMRWSGVPEDNDRRKIYELSVVNGMSGFDGKESVELAIAALEFEELWVYVTEPAPGYMIHDYLDYNPSRAQVLAERAEKHEQKVAAGKLGAAARWKPENGIKHGSPVAEAVAEAKQNDGPVPVPVPVPVPLTSSSNEEDVRRARLKQLRDNVCRLWAFHHGWPDLKWPKDRRDDAQLITVWVRDKGYPLELWQEIIPLVPKGARFRWLTTPPEKGKVCRLEEWAIARKDQTYAAVKAQEKPSDLAVGLVRKIA